MKKIKFIILITLWLMFLTVSKTHAIGTAPTIRGEDKLDFTGLDGLHEINWTITDDNPKNYEIMYKEEVVGAGSWDKPTPGAVAVTHIVHYKLQVETGTYEFEIIVYDYDDLRSRFTTVVTIVTEEAPGGPLPYNLSYSYFGLVLIAVITYKRKSYYR